MIFNFTFVIFAMALLLSCIEIVWSLKNVQFKFMFPLSRGFTVSNRKSVVSPFRKSCPAASAVGEPNIDTVVSRCNKKITDAINPDYCNVVGSNNDPNGSHITIECVASIFEGKSSLQRQRLIYKAIWDEMSGPVHAVDSIIAKTPSEAAKS